MKAHLVIESVLIAILGIHGWFLLDKMPPTREAVERSATEANQRLRLLDGRGIGVQGDPIDLGPHLEGQRVVAFLLRHGTLSEDLNFWREVGRLLPPSSRVRLLAYCDGAACVQSVTAQIKEGDFPILAYGETVAAQAVFNADLQGNFVIAREPGGTSWRHSGIQPVDIAKGLRP
jgi:hypothetical protein